MYPLCTFQCHMKGIQNMTISETPARANPNFAAMGLAPQLLPKSRPSFFSSPQVFPALQFFCRSVISRKFSSSKRNPSFIDFRPCAGFPRTSKDGLYRSVLQHGFAIAAVPADFENTSQVPGENSLQAGNFHYLNVPGTRVSCNAIRYLGTVVGLEDVQEGAAIPEGEVVILGRLSGDVHGGNKNAVVYATQVDGVYRICIGESMGLDSNSQLGGGPLIVSVQEDDTLGLRAADQKLNDDKDARSSSEVDSSVENEGASIGSVSSASKRPAQLALFTGVYISVVGLALLIFPRPLFGALFDVRSVTVGWIRVGAILAVVFGVYYIGTAIGDMRGRSGARAFYMSTVVGRVFLFFGFSWLVAVGAAQRALLLVGVVNMLGAMSMLFTLRQDSRARAIDAGKSKVIDRAL